MKPVCKFFQWSKRNEPTERGYRADIDRFYLLTPLGTVFSTSNVHANGRWFSICEVPEKADYIGEFQMPDDVWRRYQFN